MAKMKRKKGFWKEVKVRIAPDAFEGPFPCCNRLTTRTRKHVNYKCLSFAYEVWRCPRCGEDYLDNEQAKKLEGFWTMQKILDNHLITLQRNINFDGKTYFFRFPQELTKGWNKDRVAEIKLIDAYTFLVEVKKR